MPIGVVTISTDEGIDGHAFLRPPGVDVAPQLISMAKPILVVVPVLLLLLDFWPLRRAGRFRHLLLEKLPMFALAARFATGFNGFVEALRDLTVEYGKPVLLAHGHIHYPWIDKPLFRNTREGGSELVPTLTRIQTAGSPFVRWIKVTIDPQSPEVFLLVDPFINKLDSLPW